MDNKELTYFKKKLLKIRSDILNSGLMNDFEDIQIKPEENTEEGDIANNTINQQLNFSMRNREMAKLRRIDMALARIEEGTYGICLESGEEIDSKRLETQPWTEYCLEVAEEKEREEKQRFQRRAKFQR